MPHKSISAVGPFTEITYIYGLVDPRHDAIRYLGKSNNPQGRMARHLCPRELKPNTKRTCWIKSVLADGLRPNLVILAAVAYAEWENAERSWISKLPNLTNGTAGGEGAALAYPDVREKISRSNTGKTPWNKGLKLTPDQCKNNARHWLGKTGYWKGRKIPDHVWQASIRSRTGKSSWSLGKRMPTQAKMKLCKRYIVTSPALESFEVLGLKWFCKERGLQHTLMNAVASGRRKHHRGWTVKRVSTGEIVGG